jgi:hypothetical protein
MPYNTPYNIYTNFTPTPLTGSATLVYHTEPTSSDLYNTSFGLGYLPSEQEQLVKENLHEYFPDPATQLVSHATPSMPMIPPYTEYSNYATPLAAETSYNSVDVENSSAPLVCINSDRNDVSLTCLTKGTTYGGYQNGLGLDIYGTQLGTQYGKEMVQVCIFGIYARLRVTNYLL